ncbi:MAG: 1-deoxy-D-xylulose-5-phosphate synthase [Desulfobacteraceae bacterium]|nr:1-deoxy-D-xylulose-5-phosphate synthase [Desulfobacteraceae bacterium]
MGIIDRVNNPRDLKTLSRKELVKLSSEIRDLIVNVVSKTGGHLASSLGAVELAIALHYVFESPKDKIIWDVGHQSYAHKIITGRRDQFHSLRQHGGISGFTKMSENPHDAFTTGHSSTSISAGLGMASAMRMQNTDAKAVVVIGDGSMTAGLAYEGLNQTGDIHKDLIVILNDNDMSISANVGALSSFLSRTLSAKSLQNFRKNFGDFLKSLPGIGTDVYQLAKRSEESFKAFITPGMLFEAFDFEYFGPINGHNIDHLIDILINIKELKEPVLLHVRTRKGKGYPPAEKNPVYFHGVGAFEITTGNSCGNKSAIPTYTQVFGDRMVESAEIDDRIVAVTAAMPEGTGLGLFAEKFPERFFDVGIAEQHGVTFAAGLAVQGMKPVVAVYSTFLQRAYDQIVHDVCIESLPVRFAIDRGGIVGEDGPTHHGLFDFAFLRHLPNMVVMAPKDENELAQMVETALNYDKGPIAFRYPRGRGIGTPLVHPVQALPIGKAEVVAEGTDILILAIGGMVSEALAARDLLSAEQISAFVINCRFVKPLDAELICSAVHKIPRVITVEEHVLQGGFGSAVLECLNENGMSGFQLTRIGIPDVFVEHGSQIILRTRYGLTAENISNTAKALVQASSG